jgi:hypothetical protein
METLKELEKLEGLEPKKEFFFTTIDETYLLKEKIKDLECLLKSLRIENERLIDENIKLIDEKRTLKQKDNSLFNETRNE